MKPTKLPQPEPPKGPLDEARGFLELGDLDTAADILGAFEQSVRFNFVLPALVLGLDILLRKGDLAALKHRAHQFVRTFHRHPEQWFGYDRLASGLWDAGRHEESTRTRISGANRLVQLADEFYREGAVSKAGEFLRAAIRIDESISKLIETDEIWKSVFRGELDVG